MLRFRSRLPVLLVAFLLGACSSDEPTVLVPDRAPVAGAPVDNVLLVTLGGARADRLGAWGDAGAATPTLDRLAADGTRFELAIAPAPQHLPAAATVLTGTNPYDHGARNDGTHWLDGRTPTLAEALRDQGLRTIAVVSHQDLGYDSGLARGFDRYDGDLSKGLPSGRGSLERTTADNTVDRSLLLLDDVHEERWFLWVHFDDPTRPHVAPPPHAGTTADAYGDELAFVDAELARLLTAVEGRGALDRTLVVVAGTCGEGLGQHLEFGHGLLLHDTTTHVPLLFSHPGVAGGSVVPGAVGLVDVAPTVAALVGASLESRDGRSLVPALLDPNRGDLERFVYCEALAPLHEFGLAPLFGVRGAELRFVDGPRPELYEHRVDPGELSNVVKGKRKLAAEANAALDPFRDVAHHDRRAALLDLQEVVVALDPKDAIDRIQRAQAVLSEARGELSDSTREMLTSMTRNLRGWSAPYAVLAQELLEGGEPDEAIELLRQAVSNGAARASNLTRLASLELDRGVETWAERLDLAERLEPQSIAPGLLRLRRRMDTEGPAVGLAFLREWCERRQHDVRLLAELSALELEHGEVERALALARRIQRQARWWPRGMELESRALQRAGRLEEALDALERAAVATGGGEDYQILASRLEWQLGRPDEGRARIVAALARNADHLGLLLEAGSQAMASGDVPTAIGHLERLCALDPTSLEGHRRLMRCRTTTADAAGALATAERLLAFVPDDLPALLVGAVSAETTGDGSKAEELLRTAREHHAQAVARELEGNPVLRAIAARLDG